VGDHIGEAAAIKPMIEELLEEFEEAMEKE